MKIRSIALATALLASAGAQAVVVLGSPASTYGATFDNLTTTGWNNDSTIPGWELYRNPAGAVFAGASAVAGLAAVNHGTGTAGGVYSYGASGGADRALGSLGSGNATSGGNFWYLLGLSNGSNVAFDSFTLRYDGEQWRNGGNTAAHSLVLEYGFGATAAAVTTWTATGFNFTGPVATGTAGAIDGNTTGLVASIGGTIALDWQAGQTLWLRWFDANDTGNDHGLAIDNFSLSVTAVPEPGTYALMLAGLGAVGFLARRRRA
ncbi:MAG: PEP-CTERM sorting domain-containing protein [Burkholderiales bacterium]|nr:PEP-CTERM sorting domain-containing protein [Burkholderiales bacterium]